MINKFKALVAAEVAAYEEANAVEENDVDSRLHYESEYGGTFLQLSSDFQKAVENHQFLNRGYGDVKLNLSENVLKALDLLIAYSKLEDGLFDVIGHGAVLLPIVSSREDAKARLAKEFHKKLSEAEKLLKQAKNYIAKEQQTSRFGCLPFLKH